MEFTPATLRGLTGTTIWSEDHTNLVPFYRDVLGLQVSAESPQLAVLGGTTGPSLSLGTHSEVKGRAQDPFRHIVKLDSEDLDADYARLRAAGVEFIDPPASPKGMRFFTLLDPDGNVVQLQGQEVSAS